jgi:hypothetical protein
MKEWLMINLILVLMISSNPSQYKKVGIMNKIFITLWKTPFHNKKKYFI